MIRYYYKLRGLVYRFNFWLKRQWRIYSAPKDQRAVIRLMYDKMDEAEKEMSDYISNVLYGGKDLDGLGSITGPGYRGLKR